MQATGSEGLSIRRLIQAARQPSMIRELVSRCAVSGEELGEVLECAIGAGLMCWDPETGLYQATQLGKERAGSDVCSSSGIYVLV
jgi:hypothetical protein